MILIYRGPLPAAGSSSRKRQKHDIRRCFHYQLSRVIKKPYNQLFKNSPQFNGKDVKEFKFKPLICSDPFYPRRGCQLEIHALSHDPFGSIIKSGDLDNRLKTLFDALCLPNENQLPSDATPQQDEDPFWVLLSDDRMIVDFHFVQDILRTDPPADPTYMELIIKVTVKIGDVA
jgi:hypothetical protein